ncbi:hypothetical protein B9Z55_012756 [Caenorhabditis nigoni]|uniref:F-box domain-containing protein n=1 Tax=Caenorhabditis nigoni TaxID=1611254 RepID=A0A2G5TYP3_9PELO|nr:hypothetical protein B9Z55_012756 [Caenorhabditis nigoni]
MSFDIDKLAEKTENLSIEPIYETNWCDMPDDIKLECIGKMELKERSSLRCTAKAERSLVDSQKMAVLSGCFYSLRDLWINNNHYTSLTSENGDAFSKEFEDLHKTIKLIKYILKIGVFENFTISSIDPIVEQGFANYTGEISAKNIELKHCQNETVVAVLQKMKNGVESIKIDCKEEIDYKIDEILEISQVQNVPYWHILNYDKTDSLHKIAQMWIDTNSKTGSIFQVSVKIGGSFEEFSEHFADRIVSESEKRVRISTNNPDCHILLERGLDEVITSTFYPQFFRLMVISAKTKGSEYYDNCKEWIFKMDSEPYLFHAIDL